MFNKMTQNEIKALTPAMYNTRKTADTSEKEVIHQNRSDYIGCVKVIHSLTSVSTNLPRMC